MLKKFFATIAVATLVAVPVMSQSGHEGHDHTKGGHSHGTPDKAEMMQSMMKDMADCDVCSVMVPHMQTLGPSMNMEIITLNNGMAVLHTVGDDQVDLFHDLGDKMHAAGEKTLSLDEKEAEGALCGHCMQFRGLITAGAKMSHGKTDDGDIMMFTSEDPKVQKKIAAVEEEWRGMNEMMQG